MTREHHFALIGHNVSYSKSPDIFQAALDLAGLDGRFEICEVLSEELNDRLRQLALDGVSGFCVTIPHKRAIIDFLDDIDPVAQVLDAVNSVYADEGRLFGYNTDSYGFGLSLKPFAESLKCGHALILGCGGGARAVIHSLNVNFEVRRFTIFGRTPEKLREIKASLEGRLERIDISTAPLSSVGAARERTFDLIVNCTPLGGWNYPDENPLGPNFDFSRTKIYYDLNYNRDNRLVGSARDAGVVGIDGSLMLVGQAVRSFDIWTGHSIPVQQVYEAVFG
ncbi:MAG TPA: shikimate dehydrogenase [Acidobacteriota bacterium]|nr:shikimate dehydrogenase [Acidobacteriota bacterium]